MGSWKMLLPHFLVWFYMLDWVYEYYNCTILWHNDLGVFNRFLWNLKASALGQVPGHREVDWIAYPTEEPSIVGVLEWKYD